MQLRPHLLPDAARKQEFARLYIQCIQALTDYWTAHLLGSDSQLLHFIVDRTLRWGKLREVITYSQIQYGVLTREGDCVNAGTFISRASIFRSMGRLERNRFVYVTRTQSGRTGHVANVVEINFKLILERDFTMLREPKKRMKQRLLDRATPLSHREPTLVSSGYSPLSHRETSNIHKGSSQNVNDRKKQPTAGAFGTVEEALVASRLRTEQWRAAKAAKLKHGLSHGALLSAWQQCMLRHYPRVPVSNLTVKDFGVFKKLVKLNLANTDLDQFLEWVVSGWSSMRVGRLAWMNRTRELLPTAPHLDILFRYLRVFAKAYADELAGRIVQAPTAETEVKVLASKLAEAEAEIARGQRENEKLTATNERLRLVRVRKPGAAGAGRAVTSESIKDASETYNEDVELGNWR